MKRLDSALPLTMGSLLDALPLAEPELVKSQCDWVELRLDHLHPDGNPSPPITLPRQLDYLLTARAPDEGGANSLPLETRQALCLAYLDRARAIDIEAANLSDWGEWLDAHLDRDRIDLVASHHNFQSAPSLGHCEGVAEQAFASGASLVKFAFRIESLTDMQLGLDLLGLNFPGPIAVMGMGPLAPVSRLLYAQHGSCLNYGFLGATETAPGQWPAALLKQGISHLELIDPKRR